MKDYHIEEILELIDFQIDVFELVLLGKTSDILHYERKKLEKLKEAKVALSSLNE